jgi:hypothetical protein
VPTACQVRVFGLGRGERRRESGAVSRFRMCAGGFGRIVTVRKSNPTKSHLLHRVRRGHRG